MSPASRPDGGIAAAYVGFLLTGTATTILGPYVRVLEDETGRAVTTFSVLYLVQFAAHSLGATLSNIDVGRSLRFGYPLIGVGLAGLTWGWPTAILALALMGLGLGLVIPATNILVAQRSPLRRAAALSHLNLLWSAGAVGSPFVFAALRPIGQAGRAPALLAVLAGVVAVRLAMRPPAVAAAAVDGPRRPVSWFALALLASQLFLYTGAEAAAGAWIIALTAEYLGPQSVVPEIVGMSFWLGLLSGRAAAPFILRWMSETGLHRVGLALGLGAMTVVVLSHTPLRLGVGAMLYGLGLAPLFPILAAGLVAYTAAVRPAAAGPVFAIAGFGAGALPWLAGQMAARAGSVRAALLVPLLAVVLMTVLHLRTGAGDTRAASVLEGA